jgi:uncharacterized protein (UPF0264 family)
MRLPPQAQSPNPDDPIGLLVSVRCADEARAALEGGATLIDIKEPARGALGRADDETIAAVLHAVAGRRPVSAALGEWADGIGSYSDSNLSYIKWGLAGCRHRHDWRDAMRSFLVRPHPPQVVLTAYADWECAQAPPVDDVFALASAHPGSVLLIDTHCKEAASIGTKRPTLLDWMSVACVEDLCIRCRNAHVKIALAGSLGIDEIGALQFAQPDWFAVRGAACADGDRQATIDAAKVSALMHLIRSFRRPPMSAD